MHSIERNISDLLYFLDEVDNGGNCLDPNFRSYLHENTFPIPDSKYAYLTQKLYSFLRFQSEDCIRNNYSLELQIWLRDYNAFLEIEKEKKRYNIINRKLNTVSHILEQAKKLDDTHLEFLSEEIKDIIYNR